MLLALHAFFCKQHLISNTKIKYFKTKQLLSNSPTSSALAQQAKTTTKKTTRKMKPKRDKKKKGQIGTTILSETYLVLIVKHVN